MNNINTVIEAINNTEYCAAKLWKGERVYVKYDGKDVGYFPVSWDGSSSMKTITKREGTFAKIVKDARSL